MTLLERGERLSFLLIVALGFYIFTLQVSGSFQVAWAGFVTGYVNFGIVGCFGLVLRMRGAMPRTSRICIALAVYALFASTLSIATMSGFPLQRPLVDDVLFRIDAMFGYHWDAAVTLLAQYPDVAWLLRIVYSSSLYQMLLMIILLGIFRPERLHLFMLTGFLAASGTFLFWLVWPSFGPSAYLTLQPEILRAARLVVTPDYGALLMDMAQNGLPVVESHLVLGSVAFPSFHMLMAVLVIWFARGTWAFWPALVVNLLMIPATLTHGGHHAIDLPGGVFLFVLSLGLATKLLRSDRNARNPFRPAALAATADLA